MSDTSVSPKSTSLKTSELIALLCFVLSGFAALVYEISWIRKASVIVGGTTYAVSTVLAVFFGGLAIGSHVFGKRTQNQKNPIKLYGKLEIGIGILCIASVFLLPLIDSIYTSVYDSIRGSILTSLLVRAGLVSLCLLPPTILMGATLPLFCRQFVRHQNGVLNSVSWLYALNTLGATLGAAICGFLLLPILGINTSIYLAGSINILIGIGVHGLKLPDTVNSWDDKEATEEAPLKEREKSKVMGWVFALAGFSALGNEVVWTRFLTLLIDNNVYTYTLTLTVILLGIVLGSLFATGIKPEFKHNLFLFGALQILSGLLTFVIIMAPAEIVWINFMERIGTGLLSQQLMLIGIIMLIPSILAGMAFPLGIRLANSRASGIGADVGRLSALNTFGGIIGSLMIGFLVLPRLGLENAVALTSVSSVAAGFLVWAKLEPGRLLENRVAWILIVAFAFVGIRMSSNSMFIQRTRIPFDMLSQGRQIPTLDGTNLALIEGVNSFITVVENNDLFELHIDKQWQGNSKRTQQFMAGHIPSLVHGAPKSVCVVGLGTGQTAQRFLMHDIEELDLVEIEAELEPLLIRFFNGDWLTEGSLARQKTDIQMIVEDGRNYLTHTTNKYDVISIEVGQVFRPGVTSFYTHEFYQGARERLNQGGVLSQFVPLEFLAKSEFQSVVATFLETFPNSQLWYNTSELLLLGINGDETETFTRDEISQQFDSEANPIFMDDLRYRHWGGTEHQLANPEVFLSCFLANGPDLKKMVTATGLGEVSILHDDQPRLEYRTNESLDFHRPVLETIGGYLTPINSIIPDLTNALTGRCQVIRQHNLAHIEARAYSDASKIKFTYQQYDDAVAYLKHALTLNPNYAQANYDLAIMLQRIFAIKVDSGEVKDQAGMDKYLNDARAFMLRTTEIDNDNWQAHAALADVSFEEGNILACVYHLEQCVRVTIGAPVGQDLLNAHPDNLESLIFLATIYAMSPDTQLQNPEKALQMVDAGLQAVDVSVIQKAQLVSTQAAAKAMLGEFETAKQLINSSTNMIESFVQEMAMLQGISPAEAGRGYEDFLTDLTLRLGYYAEGKLYFNNTMALPKQAPPSENPLDLNNLQIPVLPGGDNLNSEQESEVQ
ncbi:MAG: fused MFS/spermidine synthase [Planctomycetaceae bacterium]